MTVPVFNAPSFPDLTIIQIEEHAEPGTVVIDLKVASATKWSSLDYQVIGLYWQGFSGILKSSFHHVVLKYIPTKHVDVSMSSISQVETLL